MTTSSAPLSMDRSWDIIARLRESTTLDLTLAGNEFVQFVLAARRRRVYGPAEIHVQQRADASISVDVHYAIGSLLPLKVYGEA